MVGVLVSDELPWRGVNVGCADGSCFDECGAAFIVHDVEGFAFECWVFCDGPRVGAEDLDAVEVDAFFGESFRLPPHFPHALAGGVVDVECAVVACCVP